MIKNKSQNLLSLLNESDSPEEIYNLMSDYKNDNFTPWTVELKNGLCICDLGKKHVFPVLSKEDAVQVINRFPGGGLGYKK